MIHLHDYDEVRGRGVHPCGYRVLVKPLMPPKEFETKSGLKLHKPDETVDKEKGGMDIGLVLEIGADCWKGAEHPWCEVGDYVRFFSYKHSVIPHPVHGDVFIINDTDILATYGEEVGNG